MPATAKKTTEVSQKETLGFQAEVKQLLHLMVHSLYSNKEIAIRELISNASDACDRLRFLAISNDALYEGDSTLKIKISFDKANRTLTIVDNGIGMNHDEVIANIGTIAKSGTREFFNALTGDEKKDASLIGQFGVGFYSSFILADKVTLKTRKAGDAPEKAVVWESAGEGDYTLEPCSKTDRGTEVTLHLREGQDEFLDEWQLKQIIHKYSDHISLPISMTTTEIDQTTKESKSKEETVNQASALWRRPKAKIKDDEYKEFYKTVSHDFGDPLTWLHARMEGTLEYSFLLYIPEQPPFDLWAKEHQAGVKLYVKRVFIMDDADKLLPRYLRFVRGVIDSDDLPLNISREILQDNQIIVSIKNTVIKRVVEHIAEMAKDAPEKFTKFWKAFGPVLKEGVVEDFAMREKLAGLCRFASTFDNKEEQAVSLDDYVFRAKKGQNKIYYLIADSFMAAKNSPLLEIFRKKGIEVLLLSDRVDHWFVTHLTEYKGKALQSVSKGDVDLNSIETDADDKDKKPESDDKSASKDNEQIVKRIQKALEEKVKEVRVSHRLTTSPACLVSQENDLDPALKRLFANVGQKVGENKPVFEINPNHTLLKRLDGEKDERRFTEWALVLYDQAVLADGGQLEDPAGFVKRLNELIVSLQQN